jgi:hypothetical protein
MSKNKSKRMKRALSQMKEDMRVLQKQIAGRSVYAKQRIEVRRPKHPKMYLNNYEGF